MTSKDFARGSYVVLGHRSREADISLQLLHVGLKKSADLLINRTLDITLKSAMRYITHSSTFPVMTLHYTLLKKPLQSFSQYVKT